MTCADVCVSSKMLGFAKLGFLEEDLMQTVVKVAILKLPAFTPQVGTFKDVLLLAWPAE